MEMKVLRRYIGFHLITSTFFCHVLYISENEFWNFPEWKISTHYTKENNQHKGKSTKTTMNEVKIITYIYYVRN